MVCLYGDVYKITATCDGTGNEYAYYSKTISPTINTTTYNKFLLRWKTSVGSVGLGARVYVGFTSGSQWILGGTTPQFSDADTWKVTSGTLTSGKYVNLIAFYADDYPDTVSVGTYDVSYEFVLFHKGTFTFPNVAHGLEFSPPPKYGIIPIFGRVGDITQGGGSESATASVSCDLDIGDWKRPQDSTSKTDYVDGEVFYDIAHNSSSEPWQWLDTGKQQFKATLEEPKIRYDKDGKTSRRTLDLLFREYRLSCAGNESYVERFGLNL